MYSIGFLYLSGYSIVSLQWSPVVSLAAPPLTSATSAAQCRFWPHVGCCVLLRGVSFWSLVPVWILCSEGPFRLWVHQHGMNSPLSCVPCWWPTLPNFTSLWSSFLSVAGLGAPLSSSLLKRRYISLQNEWMNEFKPSGIMMSEAIKQFIICAKGLGTTSI